MGVYLVQGKLVYVWFKASTGKYSTSTEHVLLMGHLINEPTHIKYVLKKDYAIDNLQVFYLKATFLKISCHIPICWWTTNKQRNTVYRGVNPT